jgi:hypothetical protein
LEKHFFTHQKPRLRNFESGKENSLSMQVAHTCNPSYSGVKDQEDCNSKPAQTDSLRPFLKNIQSKKGLVEWFKGKVCA